MAKKALLVGVNIYQLPGADLRGCVNDVVDIGNALVKFFDFDAAKIRVLTDGKATTKAMRREFTNLIDGAKPGDVLYIHYSGHGSNVPDVSGDEDDGRDEILCPTDLNWSDPFLDDWIRTTFDQVPKGVNLSVIFDCCHSGTATRVLQPPWSREPLPRFLPSPRSLWESESNMKTKTRAVHGRRSLKRSAVRGTKDIVNVNIPEVLITGCRDDQTSADAFINGTYNGALTFGLVKALTSSKGKLTYRQLHAATSAELKKRGYNQVPQLEGRNTNLDRQFLEPYA